VIIPVLNEAESIGELITSLRLQTKPPGEIVVTDGGSRDKTLECLLKFQWKRTPLRVIMPDHAYPGEGRNLAIMASKHDVLAFVDAGVRINYQWLEELLAPLEADPSIDVVFGHYEPVQDTFFTKCAAMAYVEPPKNTGGLTIRTHAIFCSAMRKSVWKEVGGFPNYRAAEDLIFIERILAGPYQVAYTKKAIAHLELRPTWRATVKRFSEYSRHNLRAGRARHWHLPLLKVYGTMTALLALSVFHDPIWAMGIVIGAAYRVAMRLAAYDVPPPAFKMLLMTGWILLSVELATFHGWLVWVFVDKCKKGEGRW
ncbi:hypothetical protein LCGC14_0892580, partial [marine sediment metagenome]